MNQPTKRHKRGWKQGKYTPRNPEKYLGDLDKIFYRSSWELDAFKFCDFQNPNVLRWSSEEIVIPYAVPTATGGVRPAKYYPDIYMEYNNAAGVLCKVLIELKPRKQTKPSRARNPKTKLYENQVFMKNQLKWDAADNWCKQNGIKFVLMNERDQFK